MMSICRKLGIGKSRSEEKEREFLGNGKGEQANLHIFESPYIIDLENPPLDPNTNILLRKRDSRGLSMARNLPLSPSGPYRFEIPHGQYPSDASKAFTFGECPAFAHVLSTAVRSKSPDFDRRLLIGFFNDESFWSKCIGLGKVPWIRVVHVVGNFDIATSFEVEGQVRETFFVVSVMVVDSVDDGRPSVGVCDDKIFGDTLERPIRRVKTESLEVARFEVGTGAAQTL